MIKVLLKNNDVNCQQKAIIVTYKLDNRYYLGPVSYTHLRAHETVLDLVCRLLLEKKKKN